MEATRLLRSIQEKYYRIDLKQTKDYLDLVKLCMSDDRTERLAACKSIFYLWDWKLISSSTVLQVLNGVTYKSSYVDGILPVAFSIISYNIELGDVAFLQTELALYQQSICNILFKHGNAILIALSVFDQMDPNLAFQHYKQILFTMLFGEFTNRTLIWSLITKRFNPILHRYLLLWLKFKSVEDYFIVMESLKLIDINDSERCFYLCVLITNCLSNGQNPENSVTLLKEHILKTSAYTQSVILLAVIIGIESSSEQYMLAVFNLYEWFLHNILIWTDLLWLMLVILLPFSQKSPYYPAHHEKALKLISTIKEKIDSGTSINLKFIQMKSIIEKYAAYRHDNLHQSIGAIRLLMKFKNDEGNLNLWLTDLISFPSNKMLFVFDALVGKFFLTGSSAVKELCLSVFEKQKSGKIHLFIFQLTRELDPLIINKILLLLYTQLLCIDRVPVTQVMEAVSEDNNGGNFNVKMTALIYACKNGYRFNDELHLYLKEKKNYIDTVALADFVQIIAYHTDIYFEEIVDLINRDLKKIKIKGSDFSISSLISAIATMCAKEKIDINAIWDGLLATVAGEQHPGVHSSVCDFLAMVPQLLKRKPDDNRIVYKSARVLWHFANDSSMNQELALRSLKDYDLELFDSSFLGDECKKHLDVNSEDDTNMPIKGDCWVHIMKNSSFTELFVHFINKMPETKFRGTYASLFRGVSNYLKTCSLKDEYRINTCLRILCAEWKSIQFEENLLFLERILTDMSFSNSDLKDLSLYALLNLCPMNRSAQTVLENYLRGKTYSGKQMAIMCLLPRNLLGEHNSVNTDILFGGLLFGLKNDGYFSSEVISGNALGEVLKTAINSFAHDYATDIGHKRIILKILVSLWIKMPMENQVFVRVSDLIAVTYGHPFLRPFRDEIPEEMIPKYIFLSRQITLHTKLLRCYDVNVGLLHKRYQGEILKNLLFVLRHIGHENYIKNLIWFIRVLCILSIRTNDYICQVVIYTVNYLAGIRQFLSSDSLEDHLEFFPLGCSILSKLTKKGKEITATLSKITKETSEVHPSIVEAFKLSILRMRDEPYIHYETTKRCLL